VMAALLLPAVQSTRSAARRNQCANNLKQIAIALLYYHDKRFMYPPAYMADAAGKPMHSWRVLILPFLEELPLYQKYNMNEPWNGPNNSKLAAQVPDVYRCPSQKDQPNSDPSETNYFVVVGPETAFPGGSRGRSLSAIKDGTSNTIAVIEASGLDVNWMEPRDLTIDEAVELLATERPSGHVRMDDGFLTTTYYESPQRNVAFCDGSVHWFGQLSDTQIAKALLTAAGGENIPQDLQARFVPPKTRTVVKWGAVWGLSVFVALAVLPAAWVRRVSQAIDSAPGEHNEGEREAIAAAEATDEVT
jgi:prepilin-type processing-associated H-X9-DG protein